MKIVSVSRITPGTAEYPIYLEMLKYDHYLYNFDDRNYGTYNTQINFFLKIILRIGRRHFRKLFNYELRKYLNICKPDILFIFKGPLLDSEIISEARKLGVFVALFYPDLDPKILGKDYLKVLEKSNIVFHTKPNLESLFSKVNDSSRLTYPLITRRFLKEINEPDEKIGVLLVANYSEKKKLSINSFLEKYDGNFTLIGSGWRMKDFKYKEKINYMGSLWGEKIYEYYSKAVCCLGLLMESLSRDGEGDEITGRSLTVPAYGGLILHPRNKSSEKLFGKTSFSLYDSINEAASKAKIILNDRNLRKRIFKEQHGEVTSKADFVEDFVPKLIKLSKESKLL